VGEAADDGVGDVCDFRGEGWVFVSVGIGFGVSVSCTCAEFSAQADKKVPSNKNVHNLIMERVFHIEINIRTYPEKIVKLDDAIARTELLLNGVNITLALKSWGTYTSI